MPLVDNQVLNRLSTADDFRRLSASTTGMSGDAGRGTRTASDLPRELRDRIALLLPADQALMEMHLCHRLPIRAAGRLLQRDPGTLTRRIHRLLGAIHDPLVRAVTAAGCSLEAEYRQLVVEHLLQFRSVPEIADRHQMSEPAVRTGLAYARGWWRGTQGRMKLEGVKT